jgi:hypothetical protein
MSSRARPRVVTAPCGCTSRPAGVALHVTPCPAGARGACPNYAYVLFAAAIRERPVIRSGLN